VCGLWEVGVVNRVWWWVCGRLEVGGSLRVGWVLGPLWYVDLNKLFMAFLSDRTTMNDKALLNDIRTTEI
jgi:hypothetical protein